MVTLHKYLVVALIVIPALMQAADESDGDIKMWLSRDARWHYTKQAGYGAAEGATVALAVALAQQNNIGNLSTPAHALVALGLSYGLSSYIRTHSSKNKSGADDSHPALAWASNLGGYLALGGTFAYFLLQSTKNNN